MLQPVYIDAEGGVGKTEDLHHLLASNAARVEDALRTVGAVVFTGLKLETAADFQHLVTILLGGTMSYAYGNTPRRVVAEGIYTATEYPPEHEISLHNELSHASSWPKRLLFGCFQPATTGGETTIGDSRELLRRLRQQTVAAFERSGVCYIRNLPSGKSGLGRSWQETFETEEPAVVEAFCRDNGTELSWRDDGSLHLRAVRPAVAVHPQTGERVWFNQAEQFHISALMPEQRDIIADWFDNDPNEYPQHATFGDGSPIPEAMFNEIRQAMRDVTVSPPWQAGSALLIDNVLVCHGRRAFRGARQVLVAMH
jgi:alpha-ketoglutarate-dependent taurine dioxygenase